MTEKKENATKNKGKDLIEVDDHAEKISPATVERYEDKNFIDTTGPVWNYSILFDDDIETFQKGTHYALYKKFGSQKITVLGNEGYYFCVWAPNATKLSVIGNFNNWNPEAH